MPDSAANRYSRQQRLPEIGFQGQMRINAASVAIVGCGALGSVAAELLGRAGVGHLILVDRDVVQWSNLQRQLLYTERDAKLGIAKAAAAAKRLARINSSIRVTPMVIDLVPENIVEAIGAADLWVDASDNFEVRYLMNDAAILLNRTWIHGGCVGTGGQVMTIRPQVTPCFQCILPEPPPLGSTATCDQTGVLGSATTVIAALQVAHAIRALTAPDELPDSKMICVDVWRGQFRNISANQLASPNCRACQLKQFDHLNRKQIPEPIILCGQNAVQISPTIGQDKIDIHDLARKLPPMEVPVQITPFFLRFHYQGYGVTVFRDGRTVIDGTQEPAIARSIRGQILGG